MLDDGARGRKRSDNTRPREFTRYSLCVRPRPDSGAVLVTVLVRFGAGGQLSLTVPAISSLAVLLATGPADAAAVVVIVVVFLLRPPRPVAAVRPSVRRRGRLELHDGSRPRAGTPGGGGGRRRRRPVTDGNTCARAAVSARSVRRARPELTLRAARHGAAARARARVHVKNALGGETGRNEFVSESVRRIKYTWSARHHRSTSRRYGMGAAALAIRWRTKRFVCLFFFFQIRIYLFFTSLCRSMLSRRRRCRVALGPCGHNIATADPGRASGSESSQRYRTLYCSRAEGDKRTDRLATRGSCATRVVRPVAAAVLHSAAIWTTGTAGEATSRRTGVDGRATRAATADNENNYAETAVEIRACARVLVAYGTTRVGSLLLNTRNNKNNEN